MNLRKGLKELNRQPKGNSSVSSGLVLNHKQVGCPDCDTIYLSLKREGKEVLFMAVTPYEAEIIADQLLDVVYGGDSNV